MEHKKYHSLDEKLTCHLCSKVKFIYSFFKFKFLLFLFLFLGIYFEESIQGPCQAVPNEKPRISSQ